MKFRRYALYYLPPEGSDWTVAATAWLGWDIAAGSPALHPDIPDLPLPVEAITRTPRKYGLHATIKPPFFLADGCDAAALTTACQSLCDRLGPIVLDGLDIARLGRFLALRPRGDDTALKHLAAACVAELDAFRAPASEAELTKRRAGGLTPAQDVLLLRWGYPYVMDQFRFHITLSGRLAPDRVAAVQAQLSSYLGPRLPEPFHISELALVGEAEDGQFHLIHRYTLSGASSDTTA